MELRWTGKWMGSNPRHTLNIDGAPAKPGVYAIMLRGVVQYVGTSENLRQRLIGHMRGQFSEGRGDHARWIVCEDKGERLGLEAQFINLLRPPLNKIVTNVPGRDIYPEWIDAVSRGEYTHPISIREEEFPAYLTERFKASGLTMEEFAQSLGIKRLAFYSLRNGKSQPSQATIEALGLIVTITKKYIIPPQPAKRKR